MARPYINVKLPKVPEFVVEKDVDNYLKLFDRVASLSDWDEGTKTAALVAELGMKWIEVVTSAGEDATIGDIVAVLKVEVKQAGLVYVKRKEFEAKAIGVNQTWRSYVNELRRLADQGYGDYHAEVVQNKIFEKLMSELPKVMRDKMINKGLLTVGTVLDQLEVIGERNAQSASYDKMKAKTAEVTAAIQMRGGEAQLLNTQLKELRAEFEKLARELKVAQSERMVGMGRRECFICRSPDHMARECPRREGQVGSGNNVGRPNTQWKCYICQDPGHLARDCPKRGERPERGNRVCVICHGTNHIADNCRQKPLAVGQGRECFHCFSSEHMIKDCPYKTNQGGAVGGGSVPQPQRQERGQQPQGNITGLTWGIEPQSNV